MVYPQHSSREPFDPEKQSRTVLTRLPPAAVEPHKRDVGTSRKSNGNLSTLACLAFKVAEGLVGHQISPLSSMVCAARQAAPYKCEGNTRSPPKREAPPDHRLRWCWLSRSHDAIQGSVCLGDSGNKFYLPLGELVARPRDSTPRDVPDPPAPGGCSIASTPPPRVICFEHTLDIVPLGYRGNKTREEWVVSRPAASSPSRSPPDARDRIWGCKQDGGWIRWHNGYGDLELSLWLGDSGNNPSSGDAPKHVTRTNAIPDASSSTFASQPCFPPSAQKCTLLFLGIFRCIGSSLARVQHSYGVLNGNRRHFHPRHPSWMGPSCSASSLQRTRGH